MQKFSLFPISRKNAFLFNSVLSEVTLQNESTKLSFQKFCLLFIIFKNFLFFFSRKQLQSLRFTKLASIKVSLILNSFLFLSVSRKKFIRKKEVVELTYKWKDFDVIWLSRKELINRVLWLGVRMEELRHIINVCLFEPQQD